MEYGLTIDTGPSIKRETTMEQFIGLDVSLKDTFISVREGGQRVWRGKCPSDPKLIAEVIRKRAPNAERVVFRTRTPRPPAAGRPSQTAPGGGARGAEVSGGLA